MRPMRGEDERGSMFFDEWDWIWSGQNLDLDAGLDSLSTRLELELDMVVLSNLGTPDM